MALDVVLFLGPGLVIDIGHNGSHGPEIPIPGSGDVLELAPTPDGLGYIASVIRRRSDGSAARMAPPRDDTDNGWTAVRVDGQQVIASSWSCFEVRLDLNSGREISRTFTKYNAGPGRASHHRPITPRMTLETVKPHLNTIRQRSAELKQPLSRNVLSRLMLYTSAPLDA